MVGAGGLFAESAMETAAMETATTGAATTAATAAGASMFSTLLPVVGIAYMAYSMFSSAKALAEQKKQQRALAEQQIKQASLLREKIKRDNAGLFSSVESAARLTTGAMGAIY